ncbi:MAG: DUF1963 domain-containing protein [Raineya sp.]|nr:DUF1963 domain-containing protein [Raineya sp.]MDW8296826.1 DUF1963 domain-containing protein [Raineya sp.]
MPIIFPERLKPFEAKLLQSETIAIRLNLQEGSHLEPWQSRIGGMPFLPKGVEYPKNAEGQFLYLLAQINFEEVPPVLEHLPRKGILQFYIADDDSYGINYDNLSDQQNFRILFFPEIDKQNYQRELPRLEKPESSPLFEPLNPLAISFETRKEIVGFQDYRIEEFLGKDYETFESILYEYSDEYLWLSKEVDGLLDICKIGGYASFTQEDPRKYDESLRKYDFLLLQLTSNDYIQWGDMGVGGFFINSDKLKQQDFSDILYSWDCA